MNTAKQSGLKDIAEHFRALGVHTCLHDHGMLCSGHGHGVMTRLPEPLPDTVHELLAKIGSEAVALSEGHRARVKCGTGASGGVLSDAAEFLVTQPGMERLEDQC